MKKMLFVLLFLPSLSFAQAVAETAYLDEFELSENFPGVGETRNAYVSLHNPEGTARLTTVCMTFCPALFMTSLPIVNNFRDFCGSQVIIAKRDSDDRSERLTITDHRNDLCLSPEEREKTTVEYQSESLETGEVMRGDFSGSPLG